MAKKRSAKFAIIGGGHFGQKRIKACLRLKNEILLEGVADKNKKLAEKAGLIAGIRPYSSIDKLLQNKNIEAVIISIPNKFHASVCVKALAAGKHVLCEKPLAINSHEAKAIVKASQRYKRLVKVGSNHRFFPSVKKAYQLYKKNLIGEILSFRGIVGNNGQLAKNSWFWKKNISGGGAFIDNGWHLLDLARMFMGNFDMCLGQTANLHWKKAEVEDYGTGIFVTEKGRQALITSSWIQWAGYLHFEIWGKKGYIFVDNGGCDKTTIGYKHREKVRTFDFSSWPLTSHQEEISYFASCIKRNSQPHPDAYEGLKVTEMVDGFYRSAESKKWVKI